MSLGSAAGVLIVALLILEGANVALRPREAETTTQVPRAEWSLIQALGFLAFAALFMVLRWAEHVWRLQHGDYAGVGLRHTWYWSVTLWVAFVLCLGRLVWLALLTWKRLS
jgi:hypothetical protein